MEYEECLISEHLLKYMDENINYGFVGKNGKVYKEPGNNEWEKDWYNVCIVQDGESLMESHYGTCWDQVELERKWFEEHNYQYKTIFMWFEVNKPNNLSTHTFLIFYNNNNKVYWFEHVFEAQKGIHEFDNEDNLIEYVKNKQLEYANNIVASDRKCIKCYEYTKPELNLDVDEYIYHATHSFEKNKEQI